MATTRTQSGSILWQPDLAINLSGDLRGGPNLRGALKVLDTWYADGSGSSPNFYTWLYGELTIAAGGDLLLAHATDPLQGFGDGFYAESLVPIGKKLKLLYIRNTHATTSFAVKPKAANPLVCGLDATSGRTLGPGDKLILENQSGSVSGALTTGSNDGLSLVLPAGASSGILLAVYGS